MLVKAVSLQPLTKRNEFKYNLMRIKEMFSQITTLNEENHDRMLVVLPEYVIGMATPQQVREFSDYLCELAQKYRTIIVGGSYPQLDKESGRYRNFSPIIDSSGRLRGGH